MSRNTVTDGAKEFDAGPEPSDRVRREGGGGRYLTESDLTLLDDLRSLIDPGARGDPMSRLQWTVKSSRTLAAALVEMGHKVSHMTVYWMLKDLGFSMQATAKTVEGKQHPDRNDQFEHIDATAKKFVAADQPVVSVDCKKKVRHEVARSERTRRSEVRPMPVA